LKIFIEQPGFSVGCVDLDYGEEEMKSFPLSGERNRVGSLLVRLREKFGDSLRVDLIDPRNIAFLFDIFRYHVKSTEPVWILDGKVIFRGVPEWKDFCCVVDTVVHKDETRGQEGE
jgi:hypothetical protein